MDENPEEERINRMIYTVINVARGDYSHEIELLGKNDELDSLAMGLNMMVDNIRNGAEKEKMRLKELEQVNEELRITRDASEIVVKDLDNKRRELNALNNELNKEITEHKKTAEALKESEEKHKTLYNSSRDAIMILEPPTWGFTAGNPATIRLFDCKDEKKFTSMGPWDVSPEFQPDGQPSSDKAKKMIEKAMKEGSNFFEWTHKTLDGKEFPATVLLTRVEIEKGKPFLQATVRDITERKRAETALQNKTNDLGERIKEMNCLLNASKIMANSEISIEQALIGIVELIPPSWKFSEVTCARITLNDKEFKTPNFMETKWTQHADIFVGKEKKGTVQVNYLEEKPDFDEGPFLFEERDIIDALSREIGKFLDRRHTEDEKTSYMKQLKEKNKELDDFTYIVSHDLKAPLITIQGFADLLKRKYNDQLDQRAVHYLENMVTAANDLNALITDLLEYSRAGRKDFKKEKVSLSDAVNRSLFSLQGMVKETHAKIEIPKDLPDIMYDPVRLGQVLNNLLSNAIIYSSSKRLPEIELGWSKENKEIKLWIKDNGIGISSDNINKVFKPFTRVSKDKRGTGIGLSIVKTIIERHGGRIWVDSQMDKGSTFYMTIPKES